MQTLSVVIANYNYEQYVAAAIESALDVDWDDVDVVVVDDGSEDGSRDVIDRYAASVTAIYTENTGQREAVNTGFAASRGDVVIFLDADDTLPRNAALEIQRHWRPTASKWQFVVQVMDEQDRPSGRAFPILEPLPQPEQMRRWLLATSAYPTPPGSGNAYSRRFLQMVLPADASAGSAADSALLVTAPLAGDVVVVPSVRVNYRRHSANDSNILSDPATRFQREVDRATQRWTFAMDFAARHDLRPTPKPDALRKSRELLQFRAAAWRMSRATRTETPERLHRLVRDVLRSPFPPGPESGAKRLAIAAFCLSVICTPEALLEQVLRRRYAHG